MSLAGAIKLLIVFFFFFSSRRRHTRFKCDWSSDVCSSDLLRVEGTLLSGAAGRRGRRPDPRRVDQRGDRARPSRALAPRHHPFCGVVLRAVRSEERRVGKECSCGWWRWDVQEYREAAAGYG